MSGRLSGWWLLECAGSALVLVVMLGCGGGASQSGSGGSGLGGGTTRPAGTATFYVNCSLASDGNGTQESPWNNLSNVPLAALPDSATQPDRQKVGQTARISEFSPGAVWLDSQRVPINAHGAGFLYRAPGR